MKALTKRSVLFYLRKYVFPHLNFITNGKLQDFKEVGGGLVSQVFRLVVDETPIFLKQTLVGEKKYYKVLKTVPKDFDFIFSNDRQIYEAKALRIFEKAVGYGFAPHVYYHDVPNKVLVLSEVCSPKAKLFEDVIHKEINLKASKTLAEVAAKLVNNTYGKIKPLRSKRGDQRIKFIKLRYQALEVYKNLPAGIKNEVRKAQEKLVEKSMKIDKVLVHGDYHPRNILVDGAKTGTVDLEEAHLGDPSFDFGILLAHYFLRGIYHKKIRTKALRAILEMYKIFMSKVKVLESKKNLADRVKGIIGGMMLGRMDGFSAEWTNWIKKESLKKKIREVAVQLILDRKTPFNKVVNKNFESL